MTGLSASRRLRPRPARITQTMASRCVPTITEPWTASSSLHARTRNMVRASGASALPWTRALKAKRPSSHSMGNASLRRPKRNSIRQRKACAGARNTSAPKERLKAKAGTVQLNHEIRQTRERNAVAPRSVSGTLNQVVLVRGRPFLRCRRFQKASSVQRVSNW